MTLYWILKGTGSRRDLRIENVMFAHTYQDPVIIELRGYIDVDEILCILPGREWGGVW